MVSLLPISVAIVAKDEADRLERCVRSLDFTDDVVVVVDDRCTDNTAQIAKDLGCQVYSRPWGGFAAQKQAAVDLAKNDWVLILDADEYVPKESAEGIVRSLERTDAGVSAYSIFRRNFFHGRWIKRCGWWPDKVVRLVDRTRGRFSDHQVHEHWVVTAGKTVQLDQYIDHHSFRHYGDLIHKLQHYSALSSRQLYLEGRKAHWWTPPAHGMWTFVQSYFFARGFTVGLDGLVISLLNGGGSFFKYAKLLELQRYGDSEGRVP